jgi:N-acetylneuraminic acid mutarotase
MIDESRSFYDSDIGKTACSEMRAMLLFGLLAAMVLSPYQAAASTSSQAAIPAPQLAAPADQPPTADTQPPGGRWSLLNAPPPRSQHVALWDAINEQMLVFGGSVGSRAADVWSYGPATDRWTQVSGAVPARAGLAGQSAVWDPVRGQFLIFGGLGPGAGGDLWSYRPASGAWADLAPSGVRPPGRAYHSAVWDRTRDQMLVFAGLGSGFGLLNDLWAYRPTSNTWVELLPPRPRPLPVFYQSAVWDPIGQQMLVFGGTDPFTGQVVDELWSFEIESGTWIPVDAPGGPPPRLSHTAIWDARGGQMIIFGGGCGANCFRDDIWSYQPAIRTWSELPAIGPFPAARGGHTAIWDEQHGAMLVFGGSSLAGALSDLWVYRPATYAWSRLAVDRPDFLTSSANRAVWDPISGQMIVVEVASNRIWTYRSADNSWTDRTTVGLSPAPREGFSVAWDPTEARLLLFGGYSRDGYLDDLWSYRLDIGWTRLNPSGPSPPGRLRQSAAWDSWAQRLLVFGGYRDGPLDDLWSYRSADNAWTRLSPVGALPPPRDRHSATWDDAHGRMLVFGGTRGAPLADLWSYDPAVNRWTELLPKGDRPPTHFDHGAAWEPTGSRMLVFGGYGARAADELWTYESALGSWRKLRPWGSPPPARGAFSVIWDASSARMLVVSEFLGGRANDLWAYRPASNGWTQPMPMSPFPSARQQHSAVWDERDGAMLLFGGYRSGTAFLDDLWSYRPVTRSWVPLAPTGPRPSARGGHSAVWDPSANQMLVFGGYGLDGYRSDLWSYRPDTNTWEELMVGGERPPPREEHAAVWDTTNGQMLLYGGDRDGRAIDDLWAYRPATNSWVELAPDGPWPAARFRHTAVWDAAGGQMLVFAGYGGGFPGGYLNDVWSYRPSADAWTRLAGPEDAPPPRSRHIAVWDHEGDRLLIAGGFAGGIDYLADLWIFSPADGSWRLLQAEGGPAARAAQAAVWDGAGRRMFVQGGSGSSPSDEFWSYVPPFPT